MRFVRLPFALMVAFCLTILPIGGRSMMAMGHSANSVNPTAAKAVEDCHGTKTKAKPSQADKKHHSDAPTDGFANCCGFGCHVVGDRSFVGLLRSEPISSRVALVSHERADGFLPDGLKRPPRTIDIG